MPIGLLVGFAGVFGVSEGIKASQAKSRREEHRSRKNNLKIHCPKSSQYSPYLEGRSVVLSGSRLYADTGSVHGVPFGHPFEGYYLPYPEARFSGLVSSITDEAPIMNWIFIDRNTYQMSFGVRAVSDGNFTGPWDCTRQEKRLTFAGWEGFCAVLEEGGIWGLYFDRDGDNLMAKLGPGRIVIEIELQRREMRMKKPPAPAQQPIPTPTPKQPESTPQDSKTEKTSAQPVHNEKGASEKQEKQENRPKKGRSQIRKQYAEKRVDPPSSPEAQSSPEGHVLPLKYKRPSVENSEEE